MNTTKNNTDALNAVITVNIEAADYKKIVDEKLKQYKKQLNLPGFRKGQIPMGLLKQKYGKRVLAEEVNKLLQKELGRYIKDEKINILGNPIEKENDDFSWGNDDFSFDFEVGIAPEINIDLQKIKTITDYKVVATDDLIEEEVDNLTKRFGTVKTEDKIIAEAKVKGVFENKEKGIKNDTTFEIKDLHKKAKEAVIGKEKEAVISLKSKDIFEEDFRLATALGKKIDEIKDRNIVLQFTVKEISTTTPAKIDDALLKKIFGKDTDVKDEAGLKLKIKEDSEKQFEEQTKQMPRSVQ